MKHKFGIVAVLLCAACWASAQAFISTAFTSDGIAESLKKDADAVYRLDEGVLEVISPSKYTLSVHQIVTILNAEGAEHLHLSMAFDKFYKVSDVEVNVFNNAGLLVRKYKKSDFSIQGYNDGFSLATDDKIMRLTAAAPEYPCTVETKYVINTSGYIDLPNWYMNTTTDAVEQFRYVVKVPSQQDIRYTTLHLDAKPQINSTDGQKIYTWEVKNVPVQKLERGGYEAGAYLPQVKVAPNEFEYDGYKGSFKNWGDFGAWCYRLYEEKKPFSDQRLEEIKALITGQPDVNSKVAILYDYLKKNMRYVSIQFGIGGYKPFAARFVDEKKYGDCKALTNYMRNLLAVAGIRSYPALINAGYNTFSVNPEFPENGFNHVILCVPNGKDSIWLECTSNNSDPNFLGSFTENKNVLLLTEAGGFLVKTPASDFNRNTLSAKTDVLIDEEGAASATMHINSTGSYYELIDRIHQLDPEKQNEAFGRYFSLRQPDQFKLSPADSKSGTHAWTLTTDYEKLFDFKAGSKFFFPVCLSSLCSEKPDVETNRNIEYLFRFPYKITDTTVFHLPQGFTVSTLPKPKQLQVSLASYSREVNVDAASNTITVISTMALKNNVIAPGAYKDVSVFFDDVKHTEAEKLILEKQ